MAENLRKRLNEGKVPPKTPKKTLEKGKIPPKAPKPIPKKK